MSSEYGTKSQQDLKAKARQQMKLAERAEPCVAVTEPNWKAMIASQNTQIEMLTQIMDTAATLTTKEELIEYLNQQLDCLTEYTEESKETTEDFQKAMQKIADEYTESMKTAISDSSKQAGKMRESFSSSLSMEKNLMRNFTKKQIMISLIPTAVLIIWELVRHIFLLT